MLFFVMIVAFTGEQESICGFCSRCGRGASARSQSTLSTHIPYLIQSYDYNDEEPVLVMMKSLIP